MNSVTEPSELEGIETDMNDSLTKFDVLLNNPRSPIFSSLRINANYNGDRNVEAFKDMYQNVQDFFEKPVPLDQLQMEHTKLEAMNDELVKSSEKIRTINK